MEIDLLIGGDRPFHIVGFTWARADITRSYFLKLLGFKLASAEPLIKKLTIHLKTPKCPVCGKFANENIEEILVHEVVEALCALYGGDKAHGLGFHSILKEVSAICTCCQSACVQLCVK